MDTYCKKCNRQIEEKCPECNKKKCDCESDDDDDSQDDVIKIKIYCLRCRKHTNSENIEKIDMDSKIQIKADCTECNAKKSRFVSKEDVEQIEIE